MSTQDAPVLSPAQARKKLQLGDILMAHARKREGAASRLMGVVIEKGQDTPFAHAALYAGKGEDFAARARAAAIETRDLINQYRT